MQAAKKTRAPVKQPAYPVLNEGSPLVNQLTHLYVPTRPINLVNGELAQPSLSSFVMGTRGDDWCESASLTSAKGSYLTQSAGILNARHPWTLFARIIVDSSTNNVNAIISTTNAKGNLGTVSDRQIGVTFTSPNLFWQGEVFDGAAKTVNHQTAIPFQSRTVISNVVVSCSDGFLRIFVDGVPCTTETAVSNNGFNGYTDPVYLCWGNLTNTSGYYFPLIGVVDGYAWRGGEALAFHANPWQLLRQRHRKIYVGTVTAGPTVLPKPPLVVKSQSINRGIR